MQKPPQKCLLPIAGFFKNTNRVTELKHLKKERCYFGDILKLHQREKETLATDSTKLTRNAENEIIEETIERIWRQLFVLQ